MTCGTPTSDTFDAFFAARYLAAVRGAYLLTFSSSAAEEIAQEAMAELFRRWDDVRHPAAYLWHCVTSRARDWGRRQQRTADRSVEVDLEALAAPDPSDVDALVVREALGRLAAPAREVLDPARPRVERPGRPVAAWRLARSRRRGVRPGRGGRRARRHRHCGSGRPAHRPGSRVTAGGRIVGGRTVGERIVAGPHPEHRRPPTVSGPAPSVPASLADLPVDDVVCPSGPPFDGAADIQTMAFDVDGDAAVDEVTLYRLGDRWRINVLRASSEFGRASDAPLSLVADDTASLSTFHIDGPVEPPVVMVTGTGANDRGIVTNFTFVTLDAGPCGVQWDYQPIGRPLEPFQWVTVDEPGHLTGLQCTVDAEGRSLVTLVDSLQRADGSWSVHSRRLTHDATRAVTGPESVRTVPDGPTMVDEYGSLSGCENLIGPAEPAMPGPSTAPVDSTGVPE